MYKVFIENIPIWFQKGSTKNEKFLTNFLPKLKKNDYKAFKKKLSTIDKKVVLPLNEGDQTPVQFFDNFRFIQAAGGIVINKKNELLFIKRHGVWDLPKGKIEQTESPETAAVREIEEECGIKAPLLEKKLISTFHTYNAYGDYWLKQTFWYSLSYSGDAPLIPQEEEGITEVKWISAENLSTVRKNTYASILDVIDTWKKENTLL